MAGFSFEIGGLCKKYMAGFSFEIGGGHTPLPLESCCTTLLVLVVISDLISQVASATSLVLYYSFSAPPAEQLGRPPKFGASSFRRDHFKKYY